MLSNACKYAIRSILYLGIQTDEHTKVGVKKIADELETPQPFLAKLLQQLQKPIWYHQQKAPMADFTYHKTIQKTVFGILLQALMAPQNLTIVF